MSVFFSKECEYAIQSVMYIARRPIGTLTSIKEISRQLDIPHSFLAKIFQKLTRKKILRSVKGISGGFALADAPEKFFLYDIVRAIDGDDMLDSCILGFKTCGDAQPCPLHEQWKIFSGILRSTLTHNNIQTVLLDLHKPEYATVS